MPRDGSSVFSAPAGTLAAPNTTIESAAYNAFVNDIVNDLNTDRPVAAGGTGASTAETARTNLGLVKQASVSDATADRLMTTGAFGLGGNAPSLTTAAGLTDATYTGWNYVASADVTSVGGPSGAGDGLVFRGRSAGATGRYQIYYPLTGSNPSPWRRRHNGTDWSTWVRDYTTGTDANGSYERRASGRQLCRKTGCTFSFNTAGTLTHEWTFPIAFTSPPHITAMFPNTEGQYTGFASTNLGLLTATSNETIATVAIRRVTGTEDFVAGDSVNNVSLFAEGSWS